MSRPMTVLVYVLLLMLGIVCLFVLLDPPRDDERGFMPPQAPPDSVNHQQAAPHDSIGWWSDVRIT